VAYGRSLEETAEFLCRSGTPFDVAARAKELGLTWQPRTRADAISAKVVRWEGDRLGVNYVFADGYELAHPISDEDGAPLARLAQAGKLVFAGDEVRERDETMKRDRA
jgi:hypothetical protein